eukprot:TRINITY_DN93284_c0_g1_i1.p1 TRINITY_DN93284_c0_g1~~TRINITY_DN93284_c0_g1_i1.p1  ORF type:complete len:220 (+),score=31.16 TRINITY_DN93284_c0_g1_i1:59-661(+)
MDSRDRHRMPAIASCDQLFRSWPPSDFSDPDPVFGNSDSSTEDGEAPQVPVIRQLFRQGLQGVERPPLEPHGLACWLWARAKEIGEEAVTLIADTSVQKGALLGATCVGSCGGTLGLCNGSVIGCSVGLITAPFTLGLSIPFFTTTIACMGWAVGSTLGGSAGLVGGGYVGYLYSEHERAVQEQRERARRRRRRAFAVPN